MDKNTIITNARKLLKERIESLKKDVAICLNGDAAFPALLYCFATIDLLGALYCGNAKYNAPTSDQSLKFMKEVMLYPEEKAVLLLEVFRHKIVHLAQPKPSVLIRDGKYVDKNRNPKPLFKQIYNNAYLWEYHHNNRGIHLDIIPTEKQNIFYFKISIWSLVKDIENSIFGSNGYIDKLVNDSTLRKKFERAWKEIFEV
jgi:hypothetical protein